MQHFLSDEFKWTGNRAVADSTSLFGKPGMTISRFTITSTKTGACRTYELDSSDRGYDDGWDGEMRVYTDNLWDGTKVTILNK